MGEPRLFACWPNDSETPCGETHADYQLAVHHTRELNFVEPDIRMLRWHPDYADGGKMTQEEVRAAWASMPGDQHTHEILQQISWKGTAN
jgi:hypothetical protein